MNQLTFIFNNEKISIYCSEKEKIKKALQQFCGKISKNLDSLYFLYSGNILNDKLTIEEIAKPQDKERKKMEILAFTKEGKSENNSFSQSEQIICPKCGELAKISINDYRIKIDNCKNNHSEKDILLNEFFKTQYIDESKIICDKCKEKNKNNSFNKEFYFCVKCKIKLCPLCKNYHDKNHYIIEYNLKDFICFEHEDKFSFIVKHVN